MHTLSHLWNYPNTTKAFKNQFTYFKKSIINSWFSTPKHTRFLLPLEKYSHHLTLYLKFYLKVKFYTRTKLTKNHFMKINLPENFRLRLAPTIFWFFPMIFQSESTIVSLYWKAQTQNATNKLHHTGHSWRSYSKMKYCAKI